MLSRINRVGCLIGFVGALAAGCTGGALDETGQSAAEIRTARTPSALHSRALINQDGTADFESSTGALDSATPLTGGIELLDLSVFDGTTLSFRRRFDVGGTPYFHSSLASVRRGQPFRVDAQVVSALSGTPTAAVVDGTALLRPDPSFAWIIGPELPGIIGPEVPPSWIIGPEAFSRIIGPEIARLGRSIPFVVFFYEKNGDVGAKLDCVLSVDGVEAQRTTDVVVAAGRLGRCEFRHTFDTLGLHALTVTLGNVVPGDFNNLNNVVSSEVTIIGPEHRGRR